MVTWTRPAVSDLRLIHDFIAQDSAFYAKKVVQDIRDKATRLDALPNIGRKVPEVDDPWIREAPIYSYRLIYQTEDGNIFILSVIHKRREVSGDDSVR